MINNANYALPDFSQYLAGSLGEKGKLWGTVHVHKEEGLSCLLQTSRDASWSVQLLGRHNALKSLSDWSTYLGLSDSEANYLGNYDFWSHEMNIIYIILLSYDFITCVNVPIPFSAACYLKPLNKGGHMFILCLKFSLVFLVILIGLRSLKYMRIIQNTVSDFRFRPSYLIDILNPSTGGNFVFLSDSQTYSISHLISSFIRRYKTS